MGIPKDWTGQKFFRLTFIEPTQTKLKSKNIVWKAKCDCGNTAYVIPSKVTAGVTKSCGCYSKECYGSRRQYDPYMTSARAVWRKCYKRFDDTCDFETFFNLSQQNCYYCNRPPHRVHNVKYKSRSKFQETTGNFIYNGLDRVDNSKSHTPENVVPCCWDCNNAKRSLSLADFLKLIELIYNNRINQSSSNA